MANVDVGAVVTNALQQAGADVDNGLKWLLTFALELGKSIKANLAVLPASGETYTPHDYENWQPNTAGPWLSDAQLDEYTQKISEALAAEKFMDGFKFALQIIAMFATLAG